MGIFKSLWNLIKKGFRAVANFFKGKSPVAAVSEAAGAITSAATTGAIVVAGVNVVRSLFIRGKNQGSNRDDDENRPSAVDFMSANRREGSVDDKITAMRLANRRPGTYHGLTQDELDTLEEVAKTRNAMFKTLKPEQQMNVLKMEGFDLEQFKKENALLKRIRSGGRRIGEATPEFEPFRTPVDRGWLNFIARPLDDFICWLKNDPSPKYVSQIKLIDKTDILNMEVHSQEELLRVVELASEQLYGEDDFIVDPKEELERSIFVEEFGKHKTFRGLRKAVKKRMRAEGGLSDEIFDLITEDEKRHKGEGKDKDKKKKKKKKHDSEIGSGERDVKLKSVKGYTKDAQDLYNKYLKDAIKGRSMNTPYGFDELFD